MRKLVICGVDDSAGAREAARVASWLAQDFDADLVLVHVGSVQVVPGASRVPGGPADVAALAHERAQLVVERVATDVGVPAVERKVAMGSAADVLARIARDERAAMLVVGSRGQGHLKGAFLGSVSAALCRSAPCPVVVVPPAAGSAGEQVEGALADDRRT